MTSNHLCGADLIGPLQKAMYNFDASSVQVALQDIIAADAKIHLCHPFGDCIGPDGLYGKAYAGLYESVPDLERRDTIVVTGVDDDDRNWIGACGYYTGCFMQSFLDIPPTGHQIGIRFHEFFRIVDGNIVEMQAIWDIPELMMQADAWPMTPSLGREWQVPAPATQDGFGCHDATLSEVSKAVVVAMLADMVKHPKNSDPKVMNLDSYWHPRMSWYGPSGIGTARGISGFRHWHQIPFLNALPDRRSGTTGALSLSCFAEGSYVAITGWPNMSMKVTGDGWLGIAPTERVITMRSLDFWRLEGNLIRENWVLIDLLDVYRQLGVDVFARMREFNKTRILGGITLERDYA